MSKSKPSLLWRPTPDRGFLAGVRSRSIALAAAHAPAAALVAAGYPWIGLAAMAPVHGALVAGTLMPRVSWFGPVTTRCEAVGDGVVPVWLTIDDGPCPEDTGPILDCLARHGAEATFFLIGERAERHPRWAAKIIGAGHSIGNHTQTHPARAFWRLGKRRLREEIARGQETLTRLASGRAPEWFRAPAGMHNPWVDPILRSLGLPMIAWSRRAYDTVRRPVAPMARRLTESLRPGEILLLHQGTGHAVELLEAVLASIRAQGACCVVPARIDPGAAPDPVDPA